MTSNNHHAIETLDLSKRYKKHLAVDELTLQVPSGSVFAFLGRNGAGKTTTIRMLLNLLAKTSGSARVLGLDPATDTIQIKKRIGYVAEAQKMYDWMTVDQITWFCKGFYPTWDDDHAESLKSKLDLPGDRKLRALSRGMQAKVALLLAMAHRPELLILDEPTAGLDVTVRRAFLESTIGMIAEQGSTVFYSTHLVHEVERIADRVAVIENGRLIECTTIQALKDRIKRVVLSFDSPPPDISLPNTLAAEKRGRQELIAVDNFSDETIARAKAASPASIEVQDMSLEEIFVALVGSPEVA